MDPYRWTAGRSPLASTQTVKDAQLPGRAIWNHRLCHSKPHEKVVFHGTLPYHLSLPPIQRNQQRQPQSLPFHHCRQCIEPVSNLIGKTIADTRLGEEYDLTVMGLIRDGSVRLGLLSDVYIEAEDVLLVKGSIAHILEVADRIGITIDPHRRLREFDLKPPEASVIEVVISQLADFAGQTLKEVDFRVKYGLTVLAIWHKEEVIVSRLSDVSLQLGDVLIVQGPRQRLNYLRRDPAFVVLGPITMEYRRVNKALPSLFIIGGMILLVSTGALQIFAAAVLAAVLMVLFGVLAMNEAYASVEWQSVFLIAGMLPVDYFLADFLDPLASLTGLMSSRADNGPIQAERIV